MELTLGYSPCPNDTYIFHALTHGLVDTGDVSVSERLEDVETLNRLALDGVLDLTKISYHAFMHVRERYCLLRSGGALGRGCGPLVVVGKPTSMSSLRGKRIAVPGRYTTAQLLLSLYGEGYDDVVPMRFDRVMDSVVNGDTDAGLIIHEGRFTFEARGLHKVADLGEWWEGETGLPIPLGGILAKRELGLETVKLVDNAIHASIEYAAKHPEAARSYIKAHAQELSDEVVDSHISLYVNEYSLDIGAEGEAAVRKLLEMAQSRGLVPVSGAPIFIE